MIVLQDSFTGPDGTRIETRAPEIGSWLRLGEQAEIKTNAMSNNYYLKSWYSVSMSIAAAMSLQMTALQLGFEVLILLARMTVSPFNAYGLKLSSSGAELIRYDAGVLTTLKSFALSMPSGTVVKFDVTGTILSCYKNGVLIDSISDITYDTGILGFYYPEWHASIARWDDALGEISVAAKVDHLPMMGLH